jgi:hypothetical protein
MAVYGSLAATIPSAEFSFTSADGLRVACALPAGVRPA